MSVSTRFACYKKENIMKIRVLLFALLLSFASCEEKEPDAPAVQKTVLSVASFNVWSPGGRTGSSGANGEDKDRLTWQKAYVAVADCIKANDPDVIGLNEIGSTAYSVSDTANIQTLLPEYSWILFKNDGTSVKEPDETSGIYTLSEAILYKSSVLTLLNRGVFWTTSIEAGSNGPNVPQSDPLYDLKAYDYKTKTYIDMCNEQRHCIWAKFEYRQTGDKFYVFCLHNDLIYSYTDINGNKIKNNQSQFANAQTVMHYAKEIVPDGVPSVILGDFNATAGDASFDLFREDARWKDAYEVVALREGNYQTSGVSITTMNGKDNATLSTIRPDHIISDGFNVSSYSVDRSKYKNTEGFDIFPSDHFLIKTVLTF